MTESPEVFDRQSLRLHRDRAAEGIAQHDFLFREVGERLLERLDDIRRVFPRALDLGCHNGIVAEILSQRRVQGGAVGDLIQADLSPAMARLAAAKGHAALAADEEALPFAAGSLDLVLSVLSLHWVNDLPGCLLQIGQALKHDGLLLAAMIGGNSLPELRAALMQAEIEMEGGASPRVSPFADLRDMGALLQRAGFALPVADVDSITVTYPSALALMQDLRGMGETNADRNRRRAVTRRDTLLRAAALYGERHGDAEGRIPASFEIIYLTGWRPHTSQPKALRPGSAAARLAEALDSQELTAGDAADPRKAGSGMKNPGTAGSHQQKNTKT
ncbi:methyltransferase domain-containing protein [Pelagibius litoralis]|uniref:Methyltransferase domain-containing protein n=1 Tax=Pelagibius litoralis TaxID=374515 RepID=A0A967F2T4_9PROT|nr:methyltransferase domain-containing protein [Pelagibius litoralis]NIA71860.1 methyltransferase domain-containing protein [Pelagibius litoralis]